MIKVEIQRDTALLRGQIAALYEIFIQQENVQVGRTSKGFSDEA